MPGLTTRLVIVVLPDKVYLNEGVETVGMPPAEVSLLITLGDVLRRAKNKVVVLDRTDHVDALLSQCILNKEGLEVQGRLDVWQEMAVSHALKPKAWAVKLRDIPKGTWVFLSPAHAKAAKLGLTQPGVYPIEHALHHIENPHTGRRRLSARLKLLNQAKENDFLLLTDQMTQEEYDVSLGIVAEQELAEEPVQEPKKPKPKFWFGGWYIVIYFLITLIPTVFFVLLPRFQQQ